MVLANFLWTNALWLALYTGYSLPAESGIIADLGISAAAVSTSNSVLFLVNNK